MTVRHTQLTESQLSALSPPPSRHHIPPYYSLFNPLLAVLTTGFTGTFAPAPAPPADAFAFGFKGFSISTPLPPNLPSVSIMGLCSCWACACSGAGLELAVVVVVAVEVVEEVELGGRELELGGKGS